MICDRRHLRAMSRAVYLLGILVGSAVFGAVSDHFGRKITFFTSIGVMVSVSIPQLQGGLSYFGTFRQIKQGVVFGVLRLMRVMNRVYF